MSYNQCSPYAQCSRDDVADCAVCGDPLAGDNDTGICYKCSQEQILIPGPLGKQPDPEGSNPSAAGKGGGSSSNEVG